MLQFTNATIMLSPSFDLQLKKFGVDMAQLKEPATNRVFCAWVEDWRKTNAIRGLLCDRGTFDYKVKVQGPYFLQS